MVRRRRAEVEVGAADREQERGERAQVRGLAGARVSRVVARGGRSARARTTCSACFVQLSSTGAPGGSDAARFSLPNWTRGRFVVDGSAASRAETSSRNSRVRSDGGANVSAAVDIAWPDRTGRVVS